MTERSALRQPDQLRPVTIEPFPSSAAGAVLITQGQTRVLCTASLCAHVPPWVRRDESGVPAHGWVTAEYAMIPGSTPDRVKRGPSSRGTEIQRLVARSLRAAVDLHQMPTVMVTVDCEVLVADGGTRTASITGGYVALQQALAAAKRQGLLETDLAAAQIAAVSVGIVDGQAVLDLDYPLDSRAEVDLNVVMTGDGAFIELQGTGEKGTFSRGQLDELLDLATAGIDRLMQVQRAALA